MAIIFDDNLDFEVGDYVYVDALEKGGIVAEIDKGRVALKFPETECIFWSPCELLRKADNPSLSSTNATEEISECSTRDVRDSKYEPEQTPALIPELERTSMILDKDILELQSKTEEVNKNIINEEKNLTDNEKMISVNEYGIALLTQQSIILAAHLRKIEPKFESIGKVKSCIEEMKIENANIRSSLVDARERIEKLKNTKQGLELHNSELEKKATFTVES